MLLTKEINRIFNNEKLGIPNGFCFTREKTLLPGKKRNQSLRRRVNDLLPKKNGIRSLRGRLLCFKVLPNAFFPVQC
jgi:hypothetical protein